MTDDYARKIGNALQAVHTMERRNNYGSVLPVATYDDIMAIGNGYYPEVKQAIESASQIEIRPDWFTRQKNKIKVVKILADEYNHMVDVNNSANRYNANKKPGQKGYSTTQTDAFYHKRGMYRAAQLGPDAAEFAYKLGRLKEALWDLGKNTYVNNMSSENIITEAKKDLQNNKSSIILSLQNPGVPVDKMIPYEGTTAAKFDPRFNNGKMVK